jgi:hypothetical protein
MIIIVYVIGIAMEAYRGYADDFRQTPPEAEKLEATLTGALIERGRIEQNPLVFSETEVINGEQSWVFHSQNSSIYAISETGKMYIFVQVDYVPLEEFFERADASNRFLEKYLAGVLAADVTSNNIDIRKTPNKKGETLVTLSQSAGNVVIVDKQVAKDESGQDWYKVLYYYDEGMFIGTYEDAYIAGRFISVREISKDEKSALKFRLDRDF